MGVLLAFPAYVAAFTLLSLFTRWALLGGLLYAFGLEGFISVIPGMVKKATLLYYSRSLVGGGSGVEKAWGSCFRECGVNSKRGPAGWAIPGLLCCRCATISAKLFVTHLVLIRCYRRSYPEFRCGV